MKKLIFSLALCCLLSISCETIPKKPDVIYDSVPANSIVVFDGVTSWKYNLDEWMVVKRETYKAVWDSFNEKDQQLRECLERERKD